MRLPARRTLQGLNHDLLDLIVTDLARCPRSGFIIEPFQPSFQKTGTPFPHHAFRAAEFSSPRPDCPDPRRRPAPLWRAAQAMAGCAPDEPTTEVARAPLRPAPMVVWVVPSASKTS